MVSTDDKRDACNRNLRRFSVTSAVHAMNEVTIHRGPSSHLIYTDVLVNGQHLTEAVADGLLVSTPTGSTAYSLSAGGAIVHPSVQSMGLTAIAARSLSFRNVLLPSDVQITLSVSPTQLPHLQLKRAADHDDNSRSLACWAYSAVTAVP
jgi:NADH kinase